MGADVSECSQALRMTGGGVLRVAAWVVVEVKEEGNLYGNAIAASIAVPRTVSGVASLYVGVDRIVSIRYRIGDRPAKFGKDGRRLISSRCGRSINHIAAIGVAWSNLPVGTAVFIRSFRVARAIEPNIKRLQAGYLRIGRCPRGAPVNGGNGRRRHNRAVVPCHIWASANAGCPGKLSRPVHAHQWWFVRRLYFQFIDL